MSPRSSRAELARLREEAGRLYWLAADLIHRAAEVDALCGDGRTVFDAIDILRGANQETTPTRAPREETTRE